MNPQQMLVPPYKLPKKKTAYTPIPDGFVSSAGNKELSAKYGNSIYAPPVTTTEVYQSILRDVAATAASSRTT